MPSVHEIEKLPIITPLRYNNEFSTGANKPILISGVDKESGAQKECVVKLMGSERMRPEAACFELLATYIAWEWGISVVEPVLVEINNAFVETLKSKGCYSTAKKSLGLNYGSVYRPNYKTLAVNEPLKQNLLHQAQKIFAFDVFIGNVDRTLKKPNCMVSADDIIIYDHELAFSFLQLITPPPEPWKISDFDRNNWIDNMVLFHKIKKKWFPGNAILKSVDRFNAGFWQRAKHLIPAEWRTDHINRIENTLNLIVQNKQAFVKNLKWVTA